MTATLIVVGFGMVSHRLVRQLAGADTEHRWRVVVLGEESRPAYDRLALSSYLGGSTATDLTLPAVHDDAVDIRLSSRVVAIDRAERVVTTSDGLRIGYDALVLATGSRPFVPPVEGADAVGCFVYRTLDDLDTIGDVVSSASTGVVIGGGLLGLEAANALRLPGVDTHVVEVAPWLMPAQLDERGGRTLTGRIEGLGITVHTGVAVSAIEAPGGRVAGVRLADGTVIKTDVVVFSAGVRPRDELAPRANLAVGERGGFLVDSHCRTVDERIWAVGECASVGGVCYGLVAPGYAMADVVVDQLLGGDAEFPGADLSTELKVLGVDVASFGDAKGTGEDSREVRYTNTITGTYGKLVLDGDARTLLGGMLVGDATAYAVLRELVGREVPAQPATLLVPAEGGTGELRGRPG